MIHPVSLRSSRLVLRTLRADDAAAIVAYRSSPEVAQYQSWESFGLDDANRLISKQAEVVPGTPGTWLQLALVLIEEAAVIGDCGIHFQADDPQQVELGITLSPSWQHRGLATEALIAVLEWAFDQLGKHRAIAVTDVKNDGATALMKRVGFRKEAHHVERIWFKGAWGSEYVFAMLRREWDERKSNRAG